MKYVFVQKLLPQFIFVPRKKHYDGMFVGRPCMATAILRTMLSRYQF